MVRCRGVALYIAHGEGTSSSLMDRLEWPKAKRWLRATQQLPNGRHFGPLARAAAPGPISRRAGCLRSHWQVVEVQLSHWRPGCQHKRPPRLCGHLSPGCARRLHRRRDGLVGGRRWVLLHSVRTRLGLNFVAAVLSKSFGLKNSERTRKAAAEVRQACSAPGAVMGLAWESVGERSGSSSAAEGQERPRPGLLCCLAMPQHSLPPKTICSAISKSGTPEHRLRVLRALGEMPIANLGRLAPLQLTYWRVSGGAEMWAAGGNAFRVRQVSSARGINPGVPPNVP